VTPDVPVGEGASPGPAPEWAPDALLPGFEALTLRFPDRVAASCRPAPVEPAIYSTNAW
jgi:hypothetical protein